MKCNIHHDDYYINFRVTRYFNFSYLQKIDELNHSYVAVTNNKMKVITRADIGKFQEDLENEVKATLIQDNVEYIYKHFVNTLKSVKLQDNQIKLYVNEKYFKVEGKHITFKQDQIMPDILGKLEMLFPDCHVDYKFHLGGADVTLSWR